MKRTLNSWADERVRIRNMSNPYNPFEAAAKHDLSKPQAANADAAVFPWLLRRLGPVGTWVMLLIAVAGLAAVVAWALLVG
jgi:anti-sigma factor RsiW